MKPKNKILQHLGFIAFAGFSASAVHAANDLWIGNTDANFATLSNWTGSVTPNGNTPQFGVAGTVGSTLNNDIASASYAGLTFNSGASAYTISGNSFALGGNIVNNGANTQTINTAMTISATRTVNATSGQLVLGGNITGAAGLTLNPTNKITLAGTNNFATGGSFSNLTVNGGAGGVDITGSTTLGNGGATNANGYLSVGGNVTVTIPSGGSLTVNGSTAATPTSAIGQNIAGTSTLLVNGGAFTIGANTGLLLANGSSGNAVLTISSGTATINRGTLATTGAGTETRLIQMGRDGTGTATINLNGGTLATGSQFVRDGSTGAGSGTANFVFGGGTLKALGAQTDWLQSTTASSAGQNQGATGGTVNTGALALSSVTTTAVSTIDANGFSVAINSAISGTGGFNINSSTGTGTVALGGANTYTGPTTISAGRLNVISPGSIDTSAVALGAATLGGNGSVADVTANNVGSIITNGNGNTDTLTLASLAFSASGTANLNLTDLNTPIAVTNTLAIGSGFTVNVTTAPSWVTGQTYNLISYATLTGLTSNILKGTISGLGARQIATLGNTGSTNGNITLAITGNTPVWTGIQSNAWTTAPITPLKNWKLLNGGAGTDFVSNDQVIFNDSATGTTSVNISTANVQVASAVFSNDSKPYTISSTGGFGIADGTSPASLTKSGTATLTLNTINSYTGSTHIDFNATLQLGDGTTNGDIASSSVITNDGTLVYNRAGGSFSYANVISGFGDVVKNGTGT
ncbi:MAG: autotransporter-associated beta strand repeat-containing protein, partial [Luteolibacter sp.]